MRVDVAIPEPFLRVAPFRRPVTEAQARFSVTYCVAAALIDGDVSPASFSDDSLARADIAQLEAVISIDAYDAGPDLDDMSQYHPDAVEVCFANGDSVRHVVADVVGGPVRPLQPEQIVDKYAACGGDASRAHGFLGCPLDAPADVLIDPVQFSSPQKKLPNE